MIQFYSPDITSNFTLPESDSQHCVRVLRHSVGDIIDVIDGKGYAYKCRIVDAHPKHTIVEIVSGTPVSQPWNNKITIAVAPTKLNDRMEWMVEKLVEIGVNNIVLLKCRHSERKEIKIERLNKIAVAAMKQSLKCTLPEIHDMIDIKQFATQDLKSYDKFVAYCDKDCERTLLSQACKPNKNTIVLIGPEGDFAPDEIVLLKEQGYVPVSLGDCRLRTETAAIVACDTIHIVNQINNQ